eukprot:GHRQ01006225.1.p1 GENE.GHRQ01006225.1~~GHRQ01006225.1.p1  ORF type:complete len:400 (+),score=162.01 GHRQ01006225.1:214-1413(+)
MANEQAVEALNNAKLATKAQHKVQHLSQLHELLVKNDPALLDGFVSELVEFQVDKAASVRRQLLDLLSAAVAARPTAAVLGATAACLAACLADEQLQVARQAAIAAHGVLQAGFAMHARALQGDAACDAAWAAVQQLLASLSSLASNAAAEVALRMAGIKLSEHAVVLYTSAAAAPLPAAAELAAAADRLIKQLAELLTAPGVQQQPGPVVICALKALGGLGLQRGQLMGKVLPGLLALARESLFKAPQPGDGQPCVAASCGAALKDMLARILRSNTDASKPWQGRLDAALRAIGAEAVADSALRHIERAAARARASERASEKRKAADQGGPDAKLPRTAAAAAAAVAGMEMPGVDVCGVSDDGLRLSDQQQLPAVPRQAQLVDDILPSMQDLLTDCCD